MLPTSCYLTRPSLLVWCLVPCVLSFSSRYSSLRGADNCGVDNQCLVDLVLLSAPTHSSTPRHHPSTSGTSRHTSAAASNAHATSLRHVVGATRRLPVPLAVANEGELASDVRLLVRHPAVLRFVRVDYAAMNATVGNETVRLPVTFECSSSSPDTVHCAQRQPLPSGRAVTVHLLFDAKQVTIEGDPLLVVRASATSGGRELRPGNNGMNITIHVVSETEVAIESVVQPTRLVLPISQQDPTFPGGGSMASSSWISWIFEVSNKGPSPTPDRGMQLHLAWPGQPFTKHLEIKFIQGEGECSAPTNATSSPGDTSRHIQHRRLIERTLRNQIDCVRAQCLASVCTVTGVLGKGDHAMLRLRTEILGNALPVDFPVKMTASARLTVTSDRLLLRTPTLERETQTQTEVVRSSEDSVGGSKTAEASFRKQEVFELDGEDESTETSNGANFRRASHSRSFTTLAGVTPFVVLGFIYRGFFSVHARN